MIWKPDTCNCVLEMNSDVFVNWDHKCELHKSFDSQSLLNQVLRHNRGYNLKFGNGDLTDQQMKQISDDKQQERIRIKLLGEGVNR